MYFEELIFRLINVKKKFREKKLKFSSRGQLINCSLKKIANHKFIIILYCEIMYLIRQPVHPLFFVSLLVWFTALRKNILASKNKTKKILEHHSSTMYEETANSRKKMGIYACYN